MPSRVLLLLPLIVAAGCSRSHPAPAAQAAPNDPRLEAGRPVIVRVVGRAKSLTIVSTPRGPAYSVSDAKGRTLLAQGSLDDLRREHPELYRQVKSGLVSTGPAGARPRDESDDPEDPSLDYLLIATRAAASAR